MLCSLCLLGQVWFQSWLHPCIGKFFARYWLVKPQMLLKFPIFLVEPYKMGQPFFFLRLKNGNLQPIPPKKSLGLSPRQVVAPRTASPAQRAATSTAGAPTPVANWDWQARLGHGPSWPIMAPWGPGTKMTWCIYDGNMILIWYIYIYSSHHHISSRYCNINLKEYQLQDVWQIIWYNNLT